MSLHPIDWAIILAFLLLTLAIGAAVARRAGRSSVEFFLSGRDMPWWLLGASMVATTFSTDTPNLVTDLVRSGGVSRNWLWWAFLITGMLTVFVYARLWRRCGVLTDMQFYELRYAGPSAAFLRGFRAIYLGLAFNVLAMAAVNLAAIKLGGILFGVNPYQAILVAAAVTMTFSALGGFRGVVLTDLILFVTAMVGSVAAAWFALSHAQVGGLDALLAHPNLEGKLSMLPDLTDPELVIGVLVIPLAVQWWSTWYPGSEPGGGGYVAQRMLAARDERHAVGATLLFNIAHYALRPWPWILVALASLIVYPDLASLERAFPNVEAGKLGHDMAYPAMLTHVPTGWLGLILASLAAAYMSTISTHLNWGSSYLVYDCYRRFLAPGAGERHLVWVGRLTTVLLMVVSAAVALTVQNAAQLFNFILNFCILRLAPNIP